MTNLVFDEKGILNKITVNVTFKKRRFSDLRMRIGCMIIKFGASIAGLGYKESENECAHGKENDFQCPIQEQLDRRFAKIFIGTMKRRW